MTKLRDNGRTERRNNGRTKQRRGGVTGQLNNGLYIYIYHVTPLTAEIMAGVEERKNGRTEELQECEREWKVGYVVLSRKYRKEGAMMGLS